jgi:hypothetical protein
MLGLQLRFYTVASRPSYAAADVPTEASYFFQSDTITRNDCALPRRSLYDVRLLRSYACLEHTIMEHVAESSSLTGVYGLKAKQIVG